LAFLDVTNGPFWRKLSEPFIIVLVEPFHVIRDAKDLSPDQKLALESLLGRAISEDECVSVRALPPAPEWLQKAWRGANERGLDRLTPDDIQAEIDEYRRERRRTSSRRRAVIRAVIDTNVLVSALINKAGNEALIVLAIDQRLITRCFSDEILDEYAEVLARPKFSFAADEIHGLIGLLKRSGEAVSSGPMSATLPDPGDAKFLVCAQTAKADLIVTGNKKHFPQQACEPIEILRAVELLDRMTFEL
jgi:putative PIN family toxin of toxin-antitoxin system